MTKPSRARLRRLEKAREAREGTGKKRPLSPVIASAMREELLFNKPGPYFSEAKRREIFHRIIFGDRPLPPLVQFDESGAIAVIDDRDGDYHELAREVAARTNAVIILPARDRLPDEDG